MIEEEVIEVKLMELGKWDILYDKYSNYIYSIIIKDKYCFIHKDDISQDVWTKIYLNKEKFTGGKFTNWISMITTRTMYDYIKRLNTDSNILRTFPISRIESLVNPIESEAEKRMQIKELHSNIEKLPVKIAAAMKLKIVGYSLKEIGKVLGISTNAANQRVCHYGKVALRKMVAAVFTFIFCSNLMAQQFTDSMDAVNFHPVWNPADTNTIAPTVYMYPTFITAKCKIVVTDCKTCRQRVINCFRKNDTDFYTDQALTKRIVFRSGWWWKLWNKELYYYNWYDVNW